MTVEQPKTSLAHAIRGTRQTVEHKRGTQPRFDQGHLAILAPSQEATELATLLGDTENLDAYRAAAAPFRFSREEQIAARNAAERAMAGKGARLTPRKREDLLIAAVQSERRLAEDEHIRCRARAFWWVGLVRLWKPRHAGVMRLPLDERRDAARELQRAYARNDRAKLAKWATEAEREKAERRQIAKERQREGLEMVRNGKTPASLQAAWQNSRGHQGPRSVPMSALQPEKHYADYLARCIAASPKELRRLRSVKYARKSIVSCGRPRGVTKNN